MCVCVCVLCFGMRLENIACRQTKTRNHPNSWNTATHWKDTHRRQNHQCISRRGHIWKRANVCMGRIEPGKSISLMVWCVCFRVSWPFFAQVRISVLVYLIGNVIGQRDTIRRFGGTSTPRPLHQSYLLLDPLPMVQATVPSCHGPRSWFAMEVIKVLLDPWIACVCVRVVPLLVEGRDEAEVVFTCFFLRATSV